MTASERQADWWRLAVSRILRTLVGQFLRRSVGGFPGPPQYLCKSYQANMTTFVSNWYSYFSLTWFHHAWIVKFTLTLSSGMSGDIDFNIIIMHGLWYWFLYYHHAWLVIFILIGQICLLLRNSGVYSTPEEGGGGRGLLWRRKIEKSKKGKKFCWV